MIAVDPSAILAILLNEPEARRAHERLAQSRRALISTANVLELQIVTAGTRRQSWSDVENLFLAFGIESVAFSAAHLTIARDAALRFGRGRHPAKLNFGDCFAYALAKSEGIPLLYVGNDFALTDIEAA